MKGADNIPLTPKADGAEYSSGDAKPAKQSRTMHYVVGAFFLINIIVLYVLHFADRGSSGSSSAVAGEFTSQSIAASGSAEKGKAVSFNADGELVVGAGTSAYLNAVDVDAIDKAVSYIRFAPLSTSTKLADANIMSYQIGASPDIKSIVTTVTGDVTAKTATVEAATDKNTIKGGSIKGLATLSDSSAVIMYSTSSADGMTITSHTLPATIKDGKIELVQSGAVVAAKGSATNFITRVSDSAFANVYYEPYTADKAYYQRVQVGTVAGSKITFSKSAQFGGANGDVLSTTVGQPQGVFNSSDRFTVPWFVDNMGATKDNSTFVGAVGLCLTTYNFAAKTANLTSLGDVCQTQYLPAYFIDSIKLSDTELAFAFVDRANKFALTVATVEFSEITGQPTFRSSYVFTDATGAFDFGVAYGFYPKPTLRVLSNNRLAVGFLNPSDSGKPSIKVLKYSSDLSLSEVSATLPISNADFSLVTADPNAFGSIVMDMIPLTSGFLVSYAGTFPSSQQQRVAFVESFGKPVGVVSDVDGSELSISTTGTVEVSSLTAGSAYYAATNGQLYVPSTSTDNSYVLADDNKVVLSKDSLVGVAVSANKLFVAAAAN